MHKIATNIHFKHITSCFIPLTFLLNMPIQPMYSIMSTSPLYTTIRILYKSALVKFMRIIIIQMMYYPIPKICSKNFTFFRVSYNKAHRSTRLPCSCIKFFTNFVFVLFLKTVKRECKLNSINYTAGLFLIIDESASISVKLLNQSTFM